MLSNLLGTSSKGSLGSEIRGLRAASTGLSAGTGAGSAEGLHNQWQSEFRPLLGSSVRWEGFSFLMADLLGRAKPVVVETGTLREPGNWKGDGQSTRLWQWVMEHKQGIAVSVDSDSHSCALARRECPSVHILCGDSPVFLRGFLPFAIDLLYLDSSDDPMNQLAELTAIWDRLPAGCLIASDDAPQKAVLTRALLASLGIEPVHDSYIAVWRKP